MVKIGDKIKVSNWDFPVTVSRIYFEDDDGNEVFEFEAKRKMLLLKWGNNGELGTSKVALHDEGKYWRKLYDLN